MAQLKLLVRMKGDCDVSGEEVKHGPNRMQHEGDGEERMAVGHHPPTQSECVERCWTSDKCEMSCKEEGDDQEQQQMVFEEVGALICGDDGKGEIVELAVESVDVTGIPTLDKQKRRAKNARLQHNRKVTNALKKTDEIVKK